MPKEDQTQDEGDLKEDPTAGTGEDTKDDVGQEGNPDDEQHGSDEDSTEEGGDDLTDEEEFDAKRAKEKISKANSEAKNLRVRLKDAEDKLKAAKSPEEVEQIVAQMTSDREAAELALLRENVALKFRLDAKVQKRLTGTTREELESDAKELADLFGASDDELGDLEGGLNPRGNGGQGSSSDPRELALQFGSRRKKR